MQMYRLAAIISNFSKDDLSLARASLFALLTIRDSRAGNNTGLRVYKVQRKLTNWSERQWDSGNIKNYEILEGIIQVRLCRKLFLNLG